MRAIGFRITHGTKDNYAVALKDGRAYVKYKKRNGDYESLVVSTNRHGGTAAGNTGLCDYVLERYASIINHSPSDVQVVIPLQVVDVPLTASDIDIEDVFSSFDVLSHGQSNFAPDVFVVRDHFLNGTPNEDALMPIEVRTQPVAEGGLVLRTSEPVQRPNGEFYHPRDLGGHSDVAVLQHLHAARINTRIYGPPGGGKTALVEAAFSDAITVNGHGDMTVAHLVGTLLPTPSGGWEWNYGPLPKAMHEGRMLFVDEGTRIPTEVLAVLYSAMDGRNVLVLDDRPDLPVVQAAPGFGVIFGYNPDTLGARELDEALVSRFPVAIQVTTDYDMALSLGVPDKAVRLAKNLAIRDTEDRDSMGPGVWVPQMRELLNFRNLINSGLDESFAVGALLGSCPRVVDLPLISNIAQQVFGYDVTTLRVSGAHL